MPTASKPMTEERYTEVMQEILHDEKVRRDLEKDPIAALQGLGLDLSDEAKAELRSGPSTAELGLAAVPAVAVRVVTGGTRPAVSVVVRSSMLSDTRAAAPELKKKD